MKLEHRMKLAEYCEMNESAFMPLLDWYVVRDRDGGYMGMKYHPSGNAKVLAVAHIDHHLSGVVHKCNRKKIVSSALDDRVGVYAALHLLPEYGIEADVLLTDYEESGDSTIELIGTGMLNKYNWIVQLDRRGTDVVTYGYTEMKPFLEEFWEVNKGSFSDICYIEDVCPVSAFNLGVGYHNEHTESCSMKWRDLHKQLMRLSEFYGAYRDVKFDRKHEQGEVNDTERRKKKTTSYSGGYGSYNRPATTTSSYYTTSKWDLDNDADWCDWCGGPVTAQGAVRVGNYDVCTLCAPHLLREQAIDDASEGKLVADVPEGYEVLEACDVCRKDCNQLFHLKHVGWWVCDDCYDESLAVLDDEGML